MNAKFELAANYGEYNEGLPQQVSLAQGEGLKTIDLEIVDGENIENVSFDTFGETCFPIFRSEPIKIGALVTQIGRNGIDDLAAHHSDLAKLENIMKISDLVKIPHVRFYAPLLSEDDEDVAIKKIIARIKDYQKIVSPKKITLVMQTDLLTYANQTERVKKILQGVKSQYVGLVFSAGDFVRFNEMPIVAYRLLRSYIKTFDAVDVDKHGLNVPLGFGESKVCDILKMAERDGFIGYVTVRTGMKSYVEARKEFSVKRFIPGYNLYLMQTPKYKNVKHIDKHINKKSSEEVTLNFLLKLQLRLLKKVILQPAPR